MAGNPYKDIMKMIQSTEKAKSLGEQFVVDLNRYIQLSKKEHTPSQSIKPSSLGGCFREQWLILQGTDVDVGKLEKAEDIGIQQMGNDRHNRLQNACQDAHNYGVDIIWCDPEEEARRAYEQGIKTIIRRRDGNELLCYNETYKASFKCDGIIIYKGLKYILEIKTEEYGKFNCRVSPEYKHEFQAALYCLCFGIDRVMFLYEDRNLAFKKGYDIVVSDQFKQEVKDRISHILAYNDKKKVPPKEKDKCTYCKYKQACKKLGDTDPYSLEELMAMEVPA
jgi:CRISPR/Cas system-associated exonuclease Cas4 (RecB family)